MTVFRTAPRATERRSAWPEQTVGQLMGNRREGVRRYAYRPDESLQVAAVVACVSKRAGAFAQLPIKAYRSSGVQLATQPTLLENPSDSVVPSIWKTQMSVSRDIWGYALGHIVAFDAALYPTKVEWLDPTAVHHRYDGHTIHWRYGGEELDPMQLVHVPSRFVLPGNPVGMSPLEHSGLVELAKRAQDFGRDWFRYGSVPSAIVYSDQALTAEQADGIVERILSRWVARKPAVLGSGLRYERQDVKPDESQFLETMTRIAADIAISFNLPPEAIGASIAGSSITYANRDQQQQQYLVDSINPDLVVIQEVLTRLLRRDEYAEFNTGALLRSDLQTRYAAHETGLRAGFLTVDEVRAMEELPPLDTQDESADARDLNVAEVVQKVYLGVGKVLTSDEARQIINAAGGELALPGPDFTAPGGAE